jgi:hypothetical protein
MKLTLFFCAGALHVETHTTISRTCRDRQADAADDGRVRVASAGMAGIPLVAGFVSKWYLLIGSVEAGQAIFAAALLVSGMLNIGYFWPVVYQAFFETPDDRDEKPLVEGGLGGRSGSAAGTTVSEDPGAVRADGHGHDHHGGPPADGWDPRGWRGGESTWFMLGPILVAASGAIALGVAPAAAVFLRIVLEIAANVGVGL